MAFNRSKFNRSPFNIQGDLVRYLQASGTERVNASIGSALNFYSLAIGNERVGTSVNGVKAKFISAGGSETVNELVADAMLSVILYPSFEENVLGDVAISAEIRPVTIGEEDVNVNAILGSDSYIIAESTENVDAESALGANIYLKADGFEFINEVASLENITTKICYLNVSLQPGQVLIIDANTYNVLLDSENAIDIHSGDWIDELNRETTDIRINAASGSANLTATILYTERYL